jgi:MoaA/NifB/PqqE/SkfB family radical SAM enzyme
LPFPEALQVEVTNECNLSCVMCVRRTWRNQRFAHMDPALFRKVFDEASGRVRRAALYGFGEPLHHPEFPELVKYAREALGDSAYLLTVTNGTLMTPQVARRVFDAGLDEVAFSVDAPEVGLLSRIRVGSSSYDVLGNLRASAAIKRDYGARLGVSIVLMRSNYRMLPRLAEKAVELDLDFMVVSHVVPYHPALVGEALYTTASREAVEFYRGEGARLGSIAREALYDMLLGHYTWVPRRGREQYLKLVEKIAAKGYSVNYEIAGDALAREPLLREVEEVIEQAREVATAHGLEARLPGVYADSLRRECPYIKSNAAVVLADGGVAPCMDLAYEHPLYTNMHGKLVRRVSFGNVRTSSLEEVWSSPRYASFRRLRQSLPASVPWCADCPFATRKCWYLDTNEYDCYGNEVGCNECVYSTGLAHCII